jgi:hypothetical protein
MDSQAENYHHLFLSIFTSLGLLSKANNKDVTMIYIPWVHVMSSTILCLESIKHGEYLNLAIWANHYDSSIKNNIFLF